MSEIPKFLVGARRRSFRPSQFSALRWTGRKAALFGIALGAFALTVLTSRAAAAPK